MVFKIVAFYLSGVLSGIFIAQCMVVLAGRSCGDFGGEMFVLPLIGSLLAVGFMLGRMFPEKNQKEDAAAGTGIPNGSVEN